MPPEQPNNNNTWLKLPYPAHNTTPTLFTQQQLQSLSQYTDSITLSHNPLISLSMKKLSRPLYVVSVSRYMNKETKEQCCVVEEWEEIGKVMEYGRMADFYISGWKAEGRGKEKSMDKYKDKNNSKYTTGNGIHNGEQDINSYQEIDEMKQLLKNKILGTTTTQPLQSYKFLPTPTQFLKPFNQTPSTADLLINKIKTNKTNFTSKNIAFGEKIPQGPSLIPDFIKNIQIYGKIVEYVEKRPCWLRNVIEYQLRMDGFKGKYTISQLKNILKYLCYTYRDGPYKHVFCRFGYNPTNTPQSIIYQTLIIKIKSKQAEDYDHDHNHNHNYNPNNKTIQSQQQQQDNNIYDPSFREIPTKYLRIYQLCDIDDIRIEKLIKQTTIISQACSKDMGWFGKNQYGELLRIVKSIREERSRA